MHHCDATDPTCGIFIFSVTALVVWMFLNEATIDSVLLAAIEQFEDQTTNRLLIAALEKYEDSGTTQKEDVKKTPAKTLPSTLTKHCMFTICIFVVNDHNKQIGNVKVENIKLNISSQVCSITQNIESYACFQEKYYKVCIARAVVNESVSLCVIV